MILDQILGPNLPLIPSLKQSWPNQGLYNRCEQTMAQFCQLMMANVLHICYSHKVTFVYTSFCEISYPITVNLLLQTVVAVLWAGWLSRLCIGRILASWNSSYVCHLPCFQNQIGLKVVLCVASPNQPVDFSCSLFVAALDQICNLRSVLLKLLYCQT